LVAGCVATPDGPATQSVQSAISSPVTSEGWSAGKQDINDIWPANSGITSCYTLMKPGYTLADGTRTFFAIVVWNTSTIGHVYYIHAGTDGQDFRNIVNQANATRTFGFSSRAAGLAGNADNNVPPIPRPHIGGDGWSVSAAELNNALDAAIQIDDSIQGPNGFLTWAP
jgi:hypothetical protein